MSNTPLVNIAIPTFNRANLLRLSLESAVAQDYSRFRITVLDNASSDGTEAVVRSFSNERISYTRHSANIGQFRNLNQALSRNDSSFVMILQDDDIIHPTFLSRTVAALLDCPEAAFAFSDASEIDGAGDLIAHQWNSKNFSAGLNDGADYLRRIVSGENLIIHMSSVLLRASALSEAGIFDTPHSRTSIDFNLFFRLAARFDLAFVAENLVQIRRHKGADHRHAEVKTRPLAMLGERMDAAVFLLLRERSKDEAFRRWICERLLHLSLRRSEMTSQMLPDLNLPEDDKRRVAEEEIGGLSPCDGPAIIVDEGWFGAERMAGRRLLPYLEREGVYFGPPSNDDEAVSELERMRGEGARFMIFAWPAFWWYDYYHGLRDHLMSQYRCVLSNSRIIVFDLAA